KKLFFVICVALNIVDLNCDKKSSRLGPNFDPDFPQFTPFSSDQFINVESDISVSNNSDPPEDSAEDSPSNNQEEQRNSEAHHVQHANVSIPMRTKAHKFSERMQPLKNFVMGLYENYRSSIANNKTMSEAIPKIKEIENKLDDDGEEMVSVYLDEDCLKDVFTGRGKKYDLIAKILPLFILPFLIQSAILPFVVSTSWQEVRFDCENFAYVYLAIFNSICNFTICCVNIEAVVVISAFKSHGQHGYDAHPAYFADPPSRRSEAAAGYRVEGKPTTWVT
ncbi:hypothetical protein Bhyg_01698, partial [Pseudolycoriella hygida]